MLFRSVENGIVEDTLPKTVIALQEWDPTSGNVPDEVVFAALYDDLVVAVEEKTHTRLGSRLNYEETGVSSLFRKTGRGVKRMDEAGPYKEQFIDLDKDWGNVETWQVLKRFSPRYTAGYFLNAFDAQQTANGIELKPEDERIYMFLFGRTLFLSIAITVSCLLLGYPIAFLLSALPLRSSNLLMILVLLPFWTSLLVRTSAWKVLLQQQGVINDFLVWTGIISDAGRLVMINNQTGTIIAMTHILLPFMILPLYSVMKTISPSYVRAAKSLGATTGPRSGGCISRRPCRASARVPCSSSFCRSVTTSHRNWWAERRASSFPTGLPTTSRRRSTGVWVQRSARCCSSRFWCSLLSTTRSSASIT